MCATPAPSAARILLDPAKHAGKTYEFTGLRTNYGEFADVLSDVLGRKITYIAATLEQAEAAMRGRQMPDWLVTHMLSVARVGGNGGFDNENTQPIRDIVGRAPITTKQFAQDYKGAFS